MDSIPPSPYHYYHHPSYLLLHSFYHHFHNYDRNHILHNHHNHHHNRRNQSSLGSLSFLDSPSLLLLHLILHIQHMLSYHVFFSYHHIQVILSLFYDHPTFYDISSYFLCCLLKIFLPYCHKLDGH